MKKSEAYINLFKEYSHVFKCPVCGAVPKTEGRVFSCQNGHSIDFSAKGTINLCYPHKKPQVLYSRKLFESRKSAYESGFFDELIAEVSRLASDFGSNTVTADIGCGEGSFLRRVIEKNGSARIGTDISPDAIQFAASGDFARIMWLTSDLASLPFAANSIDCILSILSPSNYSEFKRVLKKDSAIIKIIPGSEYLKEFRSIFQNSPDARYDNSDTLALFRNALGNCESSEILYRFDTNEALTEKLFEMTPLSQNKNFEDHPGLRDIGNITAHFVLLYFRQ